MRKIAVFTSSRAEYGLLSRLMQSIQEDADCDLQIIVSGMHLSPVHGETWRDIEADGFTIHAKVEMLLASDSAVGVVKSMGVATIGFADALSNLSPDLLVILGDRFEALAIAQAALIMRIPIAHIHGGELTQGAYDDAIRHAITKMALLHFVATDPYRRRVIQMGEDPANVHNVGALGLEQAMRMKRLSFTELAHSIQQPLQQPYVLVTYHPATLANEPVHTAFEALIAVLDECSAYHILFTYSNADNGGHVIIQMIQQYCQNHAKRAFAVPSLGIQRYFSAVANAEAVIGNSSSAIIEVPSFGKPTLNIGQRQQGRLAANSVLHVGGDYASIQAGLAIALSPAFRVNCQQVDNPYGDGMVSERILPILKQHPRSTVKSFQDLDF